MNDLVQIERHALLDAYLGKGSPMGLAERALSRVVTDTSGAVS